MRDFRAEFEAIQKEARAVEHSFVSMNPELRQELRAQRQAQARAAAQSKYASMLESLRKSVDAEKQRIANELRTKRFPLLNSTHYSEQTKELQRLRGAIDSMRAMQFYQGFPVDVLRREFDAGNLDFVFTLIDYVGKREPKDTSEIQQRAAWFSEVQRIDEQSKLAEMREQLKKLESLNWHFDLFNAMIGNDFDVNSNTSNATNYIKYISIASKNAA